jgi:hypothetical protein
MNEYHYVVNGFAGQVLVGCYSTYEKALSSFDTFKNMKHDDNCPNEFIEGAVFHEKPHFTEYRCKCGIIEMAEIWQVKIDDPLL